MRSLPFSTSLEQANSLKECSILAQEMSDLILKALKTDKRSLRSDLEKAIFKGKLERYCNLYRQTRDKFILIAKRDGKSTVYKEPQSFEKLVRDFNWQKTVTYSKPIAKNEDEEDHLITIFPDAIDYSLNKQENMAIIFKRADPEVIENAKTLDEKDFIALYIGTTASENTLKKAYADIRGIETESSISKRVGSEGAEETLTSISSIKKYAIDTTVIFEFAGTNLEGKIIDLKDEDYYTIQSNDGTKYPVRLAKIVREKEVKVPVEKISAKTSATKTIVSTPSSEKTTNTTLPSFKSLEKSLKLQIIQKLYDEGFDTTALVKAKLAETYHIGHYDDVYNVFVKVKKKDE